MSTEEIIKDALLDIEIVKEELRLFGGYRNLILLYGSKAKRKHLNAN